MKKEKIKFIIIDDHPVFREGLGLLINQDEELLLVAESGNAQEAFSQFEKRKIDFAIVDISLSGMDGIELTKCLKMKYPKLLILIVSMHDESLYALRALKAGANGYIMKQESSKKFIIAIKKVLSGKIYLSDDMQERMLQIAIHKEKDNSKSPFENLSDREFQVFQLIGNGLSVGEIAKELNISIKTVETYRSKLKEKLMLKDANELRKKAISWFKNN